MKIDFRKQLIYVLIGCLVFVALVFIGGYHDIARDFSKIGTNTLLLVLFLTLTNDFLRFAKWEYLLRTVGIRLGIKKSLLIFLSGFSMILTPAKVGEVIKSYLIKKTEGIRVRKTVGIVFFERTTDIIGVLFLSLFGLALFVSYIPIFLAIVILFMTMIFIISNEKLFITVINFVGKISILKNPADYLKDAYASSKPLLKTKTVFVTSLLSSFSWFFECLALWVILQSLGFNVGIEVATFIFAFSSIFGAVLVLPGGIGAAEGSFMTLLLLIGLSTAYASLVTIVVRLVTLWFNVGIGFLALFYMLKVNHIDGLET